MILPFSFIKISFFGIGDNPTPLLPPNRTEFANFSTQNKISSSSAGRLVDISPKFPFLNPICNCFSLLTKKIFRVGRGKSTILFWSNHISPSDWLKSVKNFPRKHTTYIYLLTSKRLFQVDLCSERNFSMKYEFEKKFSISTLLNSLLKFCLQIGSKSASVWLELP